MGDRGPGLCFVACRVWLGPLLLAHALCACADPSVTAIETVHRRAPVTAAPAAPPDAEPHLDAADSGAPDAVVHDAIEAEVTVEHEVTVAPEADTPPDTVPDTTTDTVPDTTTDTASDTTADVPEDTRGEAVDTADVIVAAPCPGDMLTLGDVCMDRWEAPNVEGERPLVMFTFYEAAAWCEARDKRLCFDDEWRTACGGAADLAYPYGDVRVPGRCNDDKIWRVYDQALLNGWPAQASSSDVVSLETLVSAVRTRGVAAAAAADHVMSLYQGTAAGERPDCVGEAGVEDLVGNVEEWVRRRDGGDGPQFSGALVGRYWAESRTCRSRVTSHGNAFRFYEIGFRCCRDETPR